MALRELPLAFSRMAARDGGYTSRMVAGNGRRWTSSQAAAIKEEEFSSDAQDLESQSSFKSEGPPEAAVESFDPVKRAKARTLELPKSRYVAAAALQGHYVDTYLGTSTDHHDTIVVRCTHINRHPSPIPRHVCSFQAPSRILV